MKGTVFVWSVNANMVNKQSRKVHKGWSSNSGVRCRFNNPPPKNDVLWNERRRKWKFQFKRFMWYLKDMKTGTWMDRIQNFD